MAQTNPYGGYTSLELDVYACVNELYVLLLGGTRTYELFHGINDATVNPDANRTANVELNLSGTYVRPPVYDCSNPQNPGPVIMIPENSGTFWLVAVGICWGSSPKKPVQFSFQVGIPGTAARVYPSGQLHAQPGIVWTPQPIAVALTNYHQ
jgi:hypothetical protein